MPEVGTRLSIEWCSIEVDGVPGQQGTMRLKPGSFPTLGAGRSVNIILASSDLAREVTG